MIKATILLVGGPTAIFVWKILAWMSAAGL
jgi:hypothetical protein